MIFTSTTVTAIAIAIFTASVFSPSIATIAAGAGFF